MNIQFLRLGLASAAVMMAVPQLAPSAPLRVATFRCDATPPLGEPMVWATPLKEVVNPLLAKGVVLEDGTNRFVLCAIDWCLIANETYEAFCISLAEAAGTEPSRVTVHSVHQHAAPYADAGAQRLLAAAPSPLPHLSEAYLSAFASSLKLEAGKATASLEAFDQVGTAQIKVERVASARRLKGLDGKITIRYSGAAKDQKMAGAPEGEIDPFLRTVTFAQAGKARVRLHYYATHPQTFCCDGRASWDFVGSARERAEQDEKVFQVYFTGCSGDVTAGKYNDGSEKARSELEERLKTAMVEATRATRLMPATNLIWRTFPLVLPLRGDKEHTLAEARGWIQDARQSDGYRAYEGAMRVSFVERLAHPIPSSSLQVGSVHILHLPGEPMLEFQLFAQRTLPKAFVAVAGYGECGPAYICTDEAIDEGAYEPSAANVGKGSEARLKAAIRHLLGL